MGGPFRVALACRGMLDRLSRLGAGWLGGAMVLMTIEKLPTFGRYITAPLGGVLLASSAVVAWHAATG